MHLKILLATERKEQFVIRQKFGGAPGKAWRAAHNIRFLHTFPHIFQDRLIKLYNNVDTLLCVVDILDPLLHVIFADIVLDAFVDESILILIHSIQYHLMNGDFGEHKSCFLYLSLDHATALFSHGQDDVINIDLAIVLNLIQKGIDCDERSRSPNARAGCHKRTCFS